MPDPPDPPGMGMTGDSPVPVSEQAAEPTKSKVEATELKSADPDRCVMR
jgi:hypothetical protein